MGLGAFICFIWLISIANCDKKLVFIHALWRHGDRTPSATFPTDTGNLEPTWPNGYGELTSIYIRSTSYNRTIMSAIANLAGMYPPEGIEIWNKNLSWQPIPVHSQPREKDPTLWMDLGCPTAYEFYKKQVLESDAVKKINSENKDFYKFLEDKTGLKDLNLDKMWNIFDPLNCELVHSTKYNGTHQLPTWVNQTVFDRIIVLYNMSMTFYYSTREIQKFRGGLLLNEIASRMKQKTANVTAPLKYYAYSVHDTTLAAFLSNLNIYDGSAPTYAMLILVELKEEGGKYFIEIYKRNGTAPSDLYHIIIPNCDPCTLDNFMAIAETRRLTKDWWTECGLKNPTDSASRMNYIIGILAGVSAIFFSLFLFVLILYLKLLKSDGYKRGLILTGD